MRTAFFALTLFILPFLGCGATVTRCAPVPKSDSCTDLSMSPKDGDMVDTWFDKGETIKVPADRCAYWTQRASEAPAKSGVADFSQRMQEHECWAAARGPVLSSAAQARPGSSAAQARPGDASTD